MTADTTPPNTETDTTQQMLADDLSKALQGVSEIVMLIAAGNQVGAGIRAAELAVDLVPPETLRSHLTQAGVTLGNEAADAIEKAKFGP